MLKQFSDRYWGCADSNWSDLHIRKNGCFDSQILGWSGAVTTQCLCDTPLCNTNMTFLLRSYPSTSILKKKLQSISRIQRRRRKQKQEVRRPGRKGSLQNDFSRTGTQRKSVYIRPEGRNAYKESLKTTVAPDYVGRGGESAKGDNFQYENKDLYNLIHADL